MRFAVQYFSSSLRLGPSEGEGKMFGSADCEGDGSAGCVEASEGVAESVGSTAPATVDDGGDSVGGTCGPVPGVFGDAEAASGTETTGDGSPVPAHAVPAPRTPAPSPSARA
jgi:hypothetical protein